MSRDKESLQESKLKNKVWIPLTFTALLLSGIYAALWFWIPEPAPRYLIFGGMLFLVIIGIVWSKYISRQVIAFSDSICDTIDQMCQEKAAPVIIPGDDGAESRIKERLIRFYEIMYGRQSDSFQAKQEIQEIISDVSHQVKTPIANVKIYTGILRQHELPEQQRQEFLVLMDGQVEKLDFLMQSMIKMSRLETGVVTLSVKETPICDTLMQALNTVLMKAEDKKIDLSVECDSGLTARHDSKWTAEAFGNILDNAVKYTPEGGSVSVTVQPWQYYVRVDITDTGIGIAEENYHNIFKRFYRAEEVVHEEGVGIGLYLAREIIVYEKGYISVKSKVGSGTTFSVYLVS